MIYSQTTSQRHPILLKARMRHSRLFAALMIALVLASSTTLAGSAFALKMMEWSGYAFIILGVFIRIYSSLFIGGRKNDELVSDGPFSIVRNPLYVGSFIAVFGIGLQTGSIMLLLILVATYAAYYPFVIRREEAYLGQKFGEAYSRYTQKTPRCIPDFSLWHSPAELTCKPYFVLRTMLDGAVFFLALPVLDTVAQLHIKGILPVWWVLP